MKTQDILNLKIMRAYKILERLIEMDKFETIDNYYIHQKQLQLLSF